MKLSRTTFDASLAEDPTPVARPEIEAPSSFEGLREWVSRNGRSRGKLRAHLVEEVKKCSGCGLAEGRMYSPVLPVGSEGSHYVVIGRSPGRTEGENGTPFFSGSPGGAYLDRYLSLLGVSRSDVHVTNSCFCRGVGDRVPEAWEVGACAKRFKGMELALLSTPKFVFLLGNDAVKVVVSGGSDSIVRGYGRSFVMRGGKVFRGVVYAFPVFHPGSVMRDRSLMDLVSDQLLMVREKYVLPFRRFLEEEPTREQILNWEV